MVDLGAGNAAKAAALFPLIAPRRYLAVDIALDHLRGVLPALAVVAKLVPPMPTA